MNAADLTDAGFNHATITYADFRGLPGSCFSPHVTPGESFKHKAVQDFRLLQENRDRTLGLTREQIIQADDWQHAFYDPDMLKQLGLPPDHNETLKKQMEAKLKQSKTSETKSAKQE